MKETPKNFFLFGRVFYLKKIIKKFFENFEKTAKKCLTIFANNAIIYKRCRCGGEIRKMRV